MNYNDVNEIANKYSEMINEVRYPEKPVKPVSVAYDSNKLWGIALDEYENNMISYRKDVQIYHEMVSILTNKFKHDLLLFLGVAKHPKAEKLYNLAWEHGHASGLSDVAYYAEDFCELMFE